MSFGSSRQPRWVRPALFIASVLIVSSFVLLVATFLASRAEEPDRLPPAVATATLDLAVGIATPTPSPTVPPSATATPTPLSPRLTANVSVNMRVGPGLEYDVLGVLNSGQSGDIVGVSADRIWWAMAPAEDPQQVVWVAAAYVTALNAGAVPVMVSPPTPTPPPTPVPAPTPTPLQSADDWLGQYWNNATLTGAPVVTRNDPTISFDWGTGTPDSRITTTQFSARWTIRRTLAAGTYRFTLQVDDGARLWLDDVLIIDEWRTGPSRTVTADLPLTTGEHEARVDYFNSDAPAIVKLEVDIISTEGIFPDWKAEYFNNTTLSGAPVVVRNEKEIDGEWGAAAPAPGVAKDAFSARWSRTVELDGTESTLELEVQGGVRLWLDTQLIIDEWTDTSETRTLLSPSMVDLSGSHVIRVEYRKLSGDGRLRVTWHSDATDGAPSAVIDGPRQGVRDETLRFDGRASTAADDATLEEYRWAFGDGSEAEGASVIHSYDEPGTYTLRLTVRDDLGREGSTQSQLSITERAPTPTALPPFAPSIAGPERLLVGQKVTYTGQVSDADATVLDFRWAFSDNTTAIGQAVDKVFNLPGIYLIVLTVADGAGETGIAELSVAVTEPTPVPPTVAPAGATPPVARN